jgi:hypothetical protein
MMQWKIAPIHNEKNKVTHYLAIQQAVIEWPSDKDRKP